MTIILFKQLDPIAKKPVFSSNEAAGADLYSIGYHEIQPGDYQIIPTGIAIELQVGFEAQIRPRSGLAAKHGVTVLNSPGTIDSDYRGEIAVVLINHGKEPFAIGPGERIAQMVVASVVRPEFVSTNKFHSETIRGDGGFGSTGR